jgi:hypothetical protein
MIPRMMFSINFLLELFAANGVKREGRKKQDRRADVNNINHRFRFKNMKVQGIASIPIHQSRRLIATGQFRSCQQISRQSPERLIKKRHHCIKKSLRRAFRYLKNTRPGWKSTDGFLI